LLQSLSIYSVDVFFHWFQTIKSLININVVSFKSIVNSIVGSLIPSVNSQLAAGM
jgi:hypothetical protein